MNDYIAMLLLALCVWAITSPRVPTGVLGTLGLGAVVATCVASFDDYINDRRALLLMCIGMLLVVAGMLWRSYGARRRSADRRPRSAAQ